MVGMMMLKRLLRYATLGTFVWLIDPDNGAEWIGLFFPGRKCKRLWPANQIAREEFGQTVRDKLSQ